MKTTVYIDGYTKDNIKLSKEKNSFILKHKSDIYNDENQNNIRRLEEIRDKGGKFGIYCNCLKEHNINLTLCIKKLPKQEFKKYLSCIPETSHKHKKNCLFNHEYEKITKHYYSDEHNLFRKNLFLEDINRTSSDVNLENNIQNRDVSYIEKTYKTFKFFCMDLLEEYSKIKETETSFSEMRNKCLTIMLNKKILDGSIPKKLDLILNENNSWIKFDLFSNNSELQSLCDKYNHFKTDSWIKPHLKKRIENIMKREFNKTFLIITLHNPIKHGKNTTRITKFVLIKIPINTNGQIDLIKFREIF